MISNNKAMFGRAAAGEASLVSAVAPKTVGAGVAQVFADTFSQQETAVSGLVGRNPLNDMPQASSATEVGYNVAGNAAAGEKSKVDFENAEKARDGFAADLSAAQKPIEQALGEASKDKGVGAAAGNDAFRAPSSGAIGVAAGMASAKMPIPAIAKLAMNKISVASSLSEGYADVKGVLTDAVKQEIAQMIVEKLSLKFNVETGGYESEIPHEIPAPVLAKMEDLSATNPQGLVEYMQELLTKPENTMEYKAMTAAIEELQADVDNYKGIEADNDAVYAAVKNEGGDVTAYDIADAKDITEGRDMGLSAVESTRDDLINVSGPIGAAAVDIQAVLPEKIIVSDANAIIVPKIVDLGASREADMAAIELDLEDTLRRNAQMNMGNSFG